MRLRKLWLLALGAWLSACASVPSVREDVEVPEEVSSFEEGCADERSVVLLCSGDECGFFPCRDLESEQVVLARGSTVAAPAAPGGAPRRWWGVWPWMRRDAEPVLTFRFYRHFDPQPPRVHQLPPGRYVRHHIFPQEERLAQWFQQQGVKNIHDFTMVIPEHIHQRIHGGGPRGGQWNEAWRQFRIANPNARPDEIYRHAGELIFRFELAGPILPYRKGR